MPPTSATAPATFSGVPLMASVTDETSVFLAVLRACLAVFLACLVADLAFLRPTATDLTAFSPSRHSDQVFASDATASSA